MSHTIPDYHCVRCGEPAYRELTHVCKVEHPTPEPSVVWVIQQWVDMNFGYRPVFDTGIHETKEGAERELAAWLDAFEGGPTDCRVVPYCPEQPSPARTPEPAPAHKYELLKSTVAPNLTLKDEPEPAGADDTIDAVRLSLGWSKYIGLFGEPPHGTHAQMAALLSLCGYCAPQDAPERESKQPSPARGTAPLTRDTSTPEGKRIWDAVEKVARGTERPPCQHQFDDEGICGLCGVPAECSEAADGLRAELNASEALRREDIVRFNAKITAAEGRALEKAAEIARGYALAHTPNPHLNGGDVQNICDGIGNDIEAEIRALHLG